MITISLIIIGIMFYCICHIIVSRISKLNLEGQLHFKDYIFVYYIWKKSPIVRMAIEEVSNEITNFLKRNRNIIDNFTIKIHNKNIFNGDLKVAKEYSDMISIATDKSHHIYIGKIFPKYSNNKWYYKMLKRYPKTVYVEAHICSNSISQKFPKDLNIIISQDGVADIKCSYSELQKVISKDIFNTYGLGRVESMLKINDVFDAVDGKKCVWDGDDIIYYEELLKYKIDYDNFNAEKYLREKILENSSKFKMLIHDKLSTVSKNINEYFRETTEIIQSKSSIYLAEDLINSCGLNINELLKKENSFLNRTLLYRKSDICKNPLVIIIRITYVSRKARNQYTRDIEIRYNEFNEVYSSAIEYKEFIETQKYIHQKERQKLSVSLRYDVLKRDNYKCCICGRSALDNLTLHIDHIIPISRGGLTTMDNLQTLCSECNLGKSDKV